MDSGEDVGLQAAPSLHKVHQTTATHCPRHRASQKNQSTDKRLPGAFIADVVLRERHMHHAGACIHQGLEPGAGVHGKCKYCWDAFRSPFLREVRMPPDRRAVARAKKTQVSWVLFCLGARGATQEVPSSRVVWSPPLEHHANQICKVLFGFKPALCWSSPDPCNPPVHHVAGGRFVGVARSLTPSWLVAAPPPCRPYKPDVYAYFSDSCPHLWLLGHPQTLANPW